MSIQILFKRNLPNFIGKDFIKNKTSKFLKRIKNVSD